jgi:FdhD protein
MRPSEGAGSIDVPVRAFSYDSGASGPELTRAIAVEAPVQIAIGGAPFAVMMATPNDLEDFAYGFALTEQIANRFADIRGVEVEAVEDGWKLKIALSGERLQAHLARGRAMSGRTGCGLCGIEDFSQMPSPRPLPHSSAPIAPEAIRAALSELEARQPLNQATRAVHAAAWCEREGPIVLVREDVGRHNALDKAIGALSRAAVTPDSGFFVITSRCSFEMVAKAAIFGANTLVSVSAPTSLALERARRFGVRVIAVARRDQALCFDEEKGEASGGLAA